MVLSDFFEPNLIKELENGAIPTPSKYKTLTFFQKERPLLTTLFGLTRFSQTIKQRGPYDSYSYVTRFKRATGLTNFDH